MGLVVPFWGVGLQPLISLRSQHLLESPDAYFGRLAFPVMSEATIQMPGTPRQNAQKSVVKAAQDEAKQAESLGQFDYWC